MVRVPRVGDRVRVIYPQFVHSNLLNATVTGVVIKTSEDVVSIEYDDPGVEQLCFAYHGRSYSRFWAGSLEILE